MQFFSDILSKFSMGQRLIVLFMLILSAVITLVLPQYWEVSDCQAFEARIQSLERNQQRLIETNDLLQKKNFELNVAILKLDSLFSNTVNRQRAMSRTYTKMSNDTVPIRATPPKIITSDCENKFHNIVHRAVNK
jgi:hypothetical protein